MPPSMMSQSWMGTDFTNDDLVKESSIVEDHTHTLVGDSTIEGRACHKVLMKPKPEAAVVWGEVQMLGGRLLPTRMEMLPADKPGQKTVIRYRSITFDQPLPEGFFTTQNITRVR